MEDGSNMYVIYVWGEVMCGVIYGDVCSMGLRTAANWLRGLGLESRG